MAASFDGILLNKGDFVPTLRARALGTKRQQEGVAAEESHRQTGRMLHRLAGARLLLLLDEWVWLVLLSTGLRRMATVTVAPWALLDGTAAG
jgi:hypothetical protein